MKKIVRQQNYLKELINSQDNKVITRQFLRCVIRAALEPLLDNPESGVVLYRIINQTGLLGLIKRLEFSEIEAYDFSDESENLKEKVWADTEFICVMSHRYVSIIIWDNKTDSKNYVRYYTIYNSKLQDEALDIINRNSVVDIKSFQEKYRPDRRDNVLLNSSIRRMIENMDEAAKDAVLGYAEFQSKPVEYSADVREIAHEIKNQLSICDLYSEVIKKYCAKNEIQDETILNAVQCIARSVQMAGNSLMALKSSQNKDLKECDLKKIVDSVSDLTKVYFECKNIEYIVESKANLKVIADEDSLTAVIVNLVKNAVEAFGGVNEGGETTSSASANKRDLENGKYVKVKAEKRGEFAVIRVLNNAGKINEPEKIFEKGFTTKSGGSGLGLSICKKSIEEQLGQLTLERTDDEYTEFVVKLGLVGG